MYLFLHVVDEAEYIIPQCGKSEGKSVGMIIPAYARAGSPAAERKLPAFLLDVPPFDAPPVQPLAKTVFPYPIKQTKSFHGTCIGCLRPPPH